MFYHIEGTVTDIEQNLVVVDCQGLGFALNATANTLSNVKSGERVKLYIAEGIGESNFDLYGFYTKSERRCFEMLTSVSGIGPKAALSILSYNTPDGLALAVTNGDEKALTVAPGVGKKIAQRVILELKDKISKEFGTVDAGAAPAVSAVPGQNSSLNDAMAALAALGYSSADIAPVLKRTDVSGMTAEQIIKSVLREMI
ncbi:MAG: Holliday junction branch migration protein RuvA [Candidatus Limivicinus sp.]|jgi:Holliday junction DNA helicase RuvA